ncbi:MAG TPA: S41 family peptidase [Saprospiraceae bacterium]|nr:S41 family peptidase [Saprospiraceae bacterium]HMQ85009.1 S41 family peptidase [Saprospiraceae bacterium]
MNQGLPSHKSVQVWLPFLLALTLVLGMLIGNRLPSAKTDIIPQGRDLNMNGLPGQGKIEEILRYIEAKYVDEVDREALMEEVISELLARLDPHSNYITASQLQLVNEQLDGNFTGIGIEFMMIEDTIVVVAPLAGGPSEAVGILANDKIVSIEDSIIAGVQMSSDDIVDMLRGEKGSKVNIGIIRGTEKKVRNFSITRDEIPMHSIDVAYMVDDKTGYIKINRFSATTNEEFLNSLKTLVEEKGMEDLVIDLRQNPGGYLQQATQMLNQLFKEKDKLLVYTEGRAVNKSEYESTGRALFNVQDIVVLIDEGSASASEILAGAIQDQDRGIIVGRRSFGKGLVQEQYKLRDGSALRLTVARYYTPSGRSIQKDYKHTQNYDQDIAERFASGELEHIVDQNNPDSDDTTKYYTSVGRIVYGGGGISPDFFVPIDSILKNDYYLELRLYLPEFVFKYVNDHRSALDMSLEDFARKFQVKDGVLEEFIQFAEAKGIKRKAGQLQIAKPEIKRLLKARIAKLLYDNEGFYTIWNQDDAMVKEALKQLTQPAPLTAEE